MRVSSASQSSSAFSLDNISDVKARQDVFKSGLNRGAGTGTERMFVGEQTVQLVGGGCLQSHPVSTSEVDHGDKDPIWTSIARSAQLK